MGKDGEQNNLKLDGNVNIEHKGLSRAAFKKRLGKRNTMKKQRQKESGMGGDQKSTYLRK